MIKEVVLLPAAIADIAQARDWYESQRVGLGNDFIKSIEKRIDAIQSNPDLFPVAYKHYRQALVRRFPYAIYYERVGEAVVVYTIFHCSRNPESWQRRLP